MKIIKLRFKNLNSLVGEWEIDFTHHEYSQQGIFAITGPTGSGKSTILDAICLALYGRTPRLDKISSSQNEIMSRQTGECLASLEFQTQQGNYRVIWEQRRSRGKADGKLQNATHVLEDLKTKRTLEDKLSKVANRIHDITGMDFEHFTRAMLLAQGGFAKFLQSSADERSPILEKITGTEIYSQISQLVHQRKNLEEQQLNIISERLAGIKPLSDTELEQLYQQFNNLGIELNNLDARLDQLIKQKNWLEQLANYQDSLTQLNQDAQKLEWQRLEFIPQQQLLERGKSAHKLQQSYYSDLARGRSHQHQLTEKLQQLRANEANLQDNCAMTKSRYEYSILQLTQFEHNYQQQLKNLEQAHSYDRQIITLQSEINNLEQTIQQDQTKQQNLTDNLEQTKQKLATEQSKLNTVQDWLTKHTNYANLTSELSGIKLEIKQLTDLSTKQSQTNLQLDQIKRDNNKLITQLEQINSEQTQLESQLAILHQQLSSYTQNNQPTSLQLSQAKAQAQQDYQQMEKVEETLQQLIQQKLDFANVNKQITEATSEYTDYQQQLEQVKQSLATHQLYVESLNQQQRLHDKINDLSKLRHNLVDGQACPLCGALEHPFSHNLPAPNDQLATQLVIANEQLKQFNQQQLNLTAKIAKTEQYLADLTKKLDNYLLHKDLLTQKLSTLEANYPLSLNSELTDDLLKQHLLTQEQLINELSQKLLQQQQLEQNITQTIQQKNQLEQEIKDCHQLQTKQQAKLDSNQHKEDDLIQQLADLDQKLTTQTKQLTTQISSYLNIAEFKDNWQDIYTNLTQMEQQYTNYQQQQKQLQENLSQLNINKTEQQTSLVAIAQQLSERLLPQFGDQQNNLANLQQQRIKLYTEDNLSLVQQQLEQQLTAYKNQVDQDNQAFSNSQEEYLKQQTAITTYKQQLDKLQQDLKLMNSEFNQQLINYAFNDEAEFLSYLLTVEQIDELTEVEQRLNQQLVQNQAMLKQTNQKYQQLFTQNLTNLSTDEIAEKIRLLNQQRDQLLQKTGSLSEQLNAEQQKRLNSLELIRNFEQQQQQFQRWNNLHKLIGSADGKKFRNFAQGLTFDLVVKHANLQLQSMSPRYLLIRDNNAPLELNVIDNYQGGEQRSTKNLSGGESFLISLALALGLSKLSSNKVQVDSLFLDEGFGTLDEEALQTALDALDSLQQNGKLIGVISHISALKERINLQIQLHAISGGVSSLHGAGCRKLI
ncbi:MAG: hypothetical protein RLZZ293_1081 [Pseudomonadota bacterium]|jgi:exonuclease SbcC